MFVLALNGTYRPQQTTTRLVRRALEGAASLGADTEMILLRDRNIQFCTNCLTCYKDLTSEIAACTIEDDVDEILEKIRAADGVILASPVHMGFVTGLMTAFLERIAFRLCRPTGELMGLKGIPEPRLKDKARAVATIVSAGGVPPELRAYCDLGTPWLKDAAMFFNGECVGDMYAGAVFPRELKENEWSRSFLYRELTEAQLTEAHDLGVTLARAIQDRTVRPYDPNRFMGPGRES